MREDVCSSFNREEAPAVGLWNGAKMGGSWGEGESLGGFKNQVGPLSWKRGPLDEPCLLAHISHSGATLLPHELSEEHLRLSLVFWPCLLSIIKNYKHGERTASVVWPDRLGMTANSDCIVLSSEVSSLEHTHQHGCGQCVELAGGSSSRI